jgi:hypothetical protein
MAAPRTSLSLMRAHALVGTGSTRRRFPAPTTTIFGIAWPGASVFLWRETP